MSAKNNNVKVKTKGNQVVKTFPNGKKVVETVNKNGKVTSKEVTTGKGKNKQTTTTNFNKDGEKTSRITVQGKGDNKTTRTIKYEDGKKAEVTTEGKVKGQNTSTVKEFDVNGNVISKTKTKGKGADAQRTTTNYTYNRNGELTEKVTKESDGTVKTIKYDNYKTNKNGKTTRKANITVTDPEDNERKYTETQTLNKNDKLTSAERYNEEGNLIRKQKKEYDEFGNLEKNKIARFYQDGSKRVVVYSNYEKNNLKAATYDVRIETTSADGEIKTLEGAGKQFFDGTKARTKDNLKETFASGIVSKIKDFTTDLVEEIKTRFIGLDNTEQEELKELEKKNKIKSETSEIESQIQNELVKEQEIQNSIQEMGEFFIDAINAQIKNPESVISASLDGFTQSEIGEIVEFVNQKFPDAKLVNNNGSYNVVISEIESWVG